MNSTQKTCTYLSLSLLLALFVPTVGAMPESSTFENRTLNANENQALSILSDLANPTQYGENISWESFVDCYTAAVQENADLAGTVHLLRNLRDAESERITWTLWNSMDRLPISISSVLRVTDPHTFGSRINEGRAIAFLKVTLLAKRGERKKISWARFVDTLTGYLHGIERYTKLCAALQSKKTSRSFYMVGMAIEKELAALPSIIQKKGEELGKKHFEEVLTEMLTFKG